MAESLHQRLAIVTRLVLRPPGAFQLSVEHRCGVRNLGDRDYSTYSRWEVEAILNVVEGRAIEGELFLGFERAMPTAKLLSLGVNVDEIGYHMPPDASFANLLHQG